MWRSASGVKDWLTIEQDGELKIVRVSDRDERRKVVSCQMKESRLCPPKRELPVTLGYVSTLPTGSGPLVGLKRSGVSSASGTALNMGPLFSGASAHYLATRAFDTPLSALYIISPLLSWTSTRKSAHPHQPPRPVFRGMPLP